MSVSAAWLKHRVLCSGFPDFDLPPVLPWAYLLRSGEGSTFPPTVQGQSTALLLELIQWRFD